MHPLISVILPILALLPNVLGFEQRSTTDASIVDLGYAQYQGVFDVSTNTTSFFGIRYAAPPVGELRWQAPQAPENVPGVLQADTEPPPCFQANSGAAPVNPFKLNGRQLPAPAESEDCLFLNVFFPGSTNPASNGTLLPTVVWIHGGGYISGSATRFTGPGSDLIQESNDGVVVVIIQYRLGVLGFLAGNQVKENGILNAGLLDQNFALRWVNQHISKFGGDPTRVTIWGESAGAGSVLQHVIAEDGKTTPQLFRAAMTSSTFLPPQYVFNETIPQTIYNQVVDQTNCTSSSDTLACLRQVETSVLQTINNQVNLEGFFGTFVTVPVIDGTFIKRRATEAFRQGKVNGKALLAVTNTNEGFIFVNQSAPLNASFYASQVFPKLGPKETSAIERAYRGLGTTISQNNLIMGEAIFVCPTYFLMRAFRDRSFKGEFAVPPAIHGMDVNYFFPTFVHPLVTRSPD
ncbi:hypothetical protein VNI00_013198 [Paramarasmius palmivorus]|uniref:Carboxylic ester hydrolase n=1 Tax=Paramarasmius palmivorus TaxID=297713 RepID=A0AAW0C096_9AGAR